MLSQKDVLDYEVRSSLIAPLFSWRWLQQLAGKFYAGKVRRKYKRYYDSKKIQKRMDEAGIGVNARLIDAAKLQEYLVATFRERVPSSKLTATTANFAWILRKIDLTAEERGQITAAVRVCKTLNL